MKNAVKIEQIFASTLVQNKPRKSKRTKRLHTLKIVLPSFAAVLIGLLVILPLINEQSKDFSLDITLPKKGELEKLHVENTTFHITDKNNRVNSFTAQSIDETFPGSKEIKFINPSGMLPINENWISIQSPYGFFNQNNNSLQLHENVNLFYNQGMDLKTAYLHYDFNTNLGYGDQPINGNGVFGTIHAEQYEFNTKDNIFTFKGKTQITLHAESFSKEKK